MRGKTPRKAVEAEDGGYRENGEGEAKGHFAKPAKGIQQRKKVLADWRMGVESRRRASCALSVAGAQGT